MITSEQYNVHNIGRNHTTQKTKVTMTRFYSASQFQCCFIIQIGYLDFMDMHQWFEYLGMTLTSTETTLIETLQCMFGR